MLAAGKAKISLGNPKNLESYLIDFTSVDGNFAPLLGLQTAQKMELLVTFCRLERMHHPLMLRSLSSQVIQ